MTREKRILFIIGGGIAGVGLAYYLAQQGQTDILVSYTYRIAFDPDYAKYSAGLVTKSADPELAKEFIKRLTGFTAQPVLSAAGFDVGSGS